MENLDFEAGKFILELAYIISAIVLAGCVGGYYAFKGRNEVTMNVILFIVLVVGGWVFLEVSGM